MRAGVIERGQRVVSDLPLMAEHRPDVRPQPLAEGQEPGGVSVEVRDLGSLGVLPAGLVDQDGVGGGHQESDHVDGE